MVTSELGRDGWEGLVEAWGGGWEWRRLVEWLAERPGEGDTEDGGEGPSLRRIARSKATNHHMMLYSGLLLAIHPLKPVWPHRDRHTDTPGSLCETVVSP